MTSSRRINRAEFNFKAVGWSSLNCDVNSDAAARDFVGTFRSEQVSENMWKKISVDFEII